MSAMWSYFQCWGSTLQEAAYALNQHPIYVAISPLTTIHWSSSENTEMVVAPLSITPSVPQQNLHFQSSQP